MKLKHLFCLCIVVLGLQSCEILQTARFARCEFLFDRIETLEAASVPIRGKSGVSDLTWQDGAKISAGMLAQSMPINLKMWMQIKNPNSRPAALNTVDWELLIKEDVVLTGTTDKKISVAGNGGTSPMSLSFDFDLFKVLNGKSSTEVANILWSIATNSKSPKTLTLRLKPSFSIGGNTYKYPGYINLKY